MSNITSNTIYIRNDFMKGMNYAGFHTDVFSHSGSDKAISKLNKININWVAINLCWYQDGRHATEIVRHSTKTPSDTSLIHLFREIRKFGGKIMLKPMVDSFDHAWRGTFNPSSWDEWFASYEKFILHYARLAEEHGVELFCIGCEYPLYRKHKQQHWRDLIVQIRQNYNGPLTYAANFNKKNSFKHVKFWDLLDYIGIDAYFAVADKASPTLGRVLKGWNRHVRRVERWYRRNGHNKPMIFTELGICSMRGACMEPWSYDKKNEPNWKEQAHYYEAFFRTFRNKNWFKGVFWWWWDNPSTADYIGRNEGGNYQISYTPQGKDAERVIERYFS